LGESALARERGARIPPRDYRANEKIRVPQVRVVDEEGKQLGVLPTRQALEVADERGYDLVEVAPGADPPVCRLMDFGKFKYEATRKEREARRARRARPTNELREVRMKTRIGEHDRLAKTRLAKRLLGQGAKVKVSVMFRGRENEHPEIGMALLKLVAEALVDDAALESPPNFESRRMLSMILAPVSAPGASQQNTNQDREKVRA
jgi:translation initiation factor IF-3